MDVSKSFPSHNQMPVNLAVQTKQNKTHTRSEQKERRKNESGVTMDLSAHAAQNRMQHIEKQFQSRKENLQNQIQSLSSKILDAKQVGNDALHDELLLKVKDLSESILQLDQEKAAAIAEEQKRQLEEAEQKQKEQAEKAKRKQNEKQTDEEKQELAEREQTKFFIDADQAFASIGSHKLLKAKLESSKTRLETEMATDGVRLSDQRQSILAAKTARKNGISSVPWVSGKSFSTEMKRLALGAYQSHESEKVKELSRLTAGIQALDSVINKSMMEINKSVEERNEKIKQEQTEEPKEKEATEEKSEEQKEKEQKTEQ